MSTNDNANKTNNSNVTCIEDLEHIIDAYDRECVYEFDIKLPNGKTAGKVGDTNAPLRRQMEWAKVCCGSRRR